MGPSGGDVPDAERMRAGVVMHDAGEQQVAGSPGTGDGLVEQFTGTHRVDQVDAHQVSRQGFGEQDVIAQQPGPLDGFLAERQAALRLAGEVVDGGEDRRASMSSRLSSSWRANSTACSPYRRADAMSETRETSVATISAWPNSTGSARASGRSSAGVSGARASAPTLR